MTRLLFFYGTLMSGHMRSGAAERAGLRLVGPGKLRGDLYSVGDSFPAFVDGDGEILGEVWEAPTNEILRGALHVTDMIEGYSDRRPPESCMYLREERQLLDGRTVLVYRWNRGQRDAMIGLRPIPSGDWRAYAKTTHWGSRIAEVEEVDLVADDQVDEWEREVWEPDLILDTPTGPVLVDFKTEEDR